MEEAALQHELRQIKRRRIEIRGAKANLDMEDLHLDDRQSAIEQLLRARRIAPQGHVGGQHTPQNNVLLLGPQAHQPTPRSDTSRDTQRVHQKNVATRRELYKTTMDNKTVIAIDDDEEGNGDEDDDDVRMFTRKNNAAPSSGDLESKNFKTRNTQQKTMFNRTRLDDNTPKSHPKPSKIVVLKVRYDPSQPRHVQHLQTKKALFRRSTQSNPSTQPPFPYRERYENPQPQNVQSVIQSTKPTQSQPHHRTSPPFPSQQNPLSNPPTPIPTPTLQPCTCSKRNCRTCRGTPAVIAEGRKRLQLLQASTPTNTHSSSGPPSSPPRLTRRHNTTTTTKPTPSYHIATYEEMTSSERADLELRFCRRIVAALWSIRNRNTVPSSTSTSTPPWAERLATRADLWDFLLSELSLLLKRRPVAREDVEGTWDGAVLVSKAGDLVEFVDGVSDVLGRATRGHPVGCCVLDKEDMEVEGDGDVGSGVRHECWGTGFWEWFEVRVARCRDCIGACVAALNLAERRGLVDEWDVG